MIRKFAPADPWLFLLSLLATVLGFFAIFDAGYARSIRLDEGALPREFRMQVLFGVIGIVFAGWIGCVSFQKWRRFAPWAMALSFLAVMALMIQPISVTLSGATRWLRLGPVQIQPSEFAKVAVVLYLAAFFAQFKPWKHPKVRDWADWLDKVAIPKFFRAWPLLVVGVVALKIELEPDLGTAAIILATMMLMFWLGGVSRKSMIWLCVLGSVLISGIALKQPYRVERITTHFTRWDAKNVDDIGWQTTQSEQAMADGGWQGQGIGAGRAKHIIPAATTDFIMATIAEEFGLIGSLGVIALLGAIVWRLILLSRYCTDRCAALYLLGVAAWLTVQSCVNIVMANGTWPPIGIPLPFFSSGGSSLLALWIALGLAQSAVVYSVQEEIEVEDSSNRRGNRGTRVSGAGDREGVLAGRR